MQTLTPGEATKYGHELFALAQKARHVVRDLDPEVRETFHPVSCILPHSFKWFRMTLSTSVSALRTERFSLLPETDT